MEVQNSKDDKLPSPIDLTKPLPEVLQQLGAVVQSKKCQKLGTLSIIARRLQARGNMSRETAFRLLKQVSDSKPPRMMSEFVMVLQVLGYTTIDAASKSDVDAPVTNVADQE
jgi:hypothetical protein